MPQLNEATFDNFGNTVIIRFDISQNSKLHNDTHTLLSELRKFNKRYNEDKL